MADDSDILNDLAARFGGAILASAPARDGTTAIWVQPDKAHSILHHLKFETPLPYRMLYDLTAIDERTRRDRVASATSLYTIVYHVMSLDRNRDLRIHVPLAGTSPAVTTVTDLWPCADWYEREVFDMFGIDVTGHKRLRRILNPPWWQGHPLRKDYPARATEGQPYGLDLKSIAAMDDQLVFKPKDWGLEESNGDLTILNIGPHHPGTHGVLRLVLQLSQEEIVDMVPDIGFHHRGAEKMGERQTWHKYIPYTDRVDYLGGVMNNLPYVLSVEAIAGIDVPQRVKIIRVMLSELFRIISHLVWFGTFTLDLGQMSPVFYMFSDRERALEIIEAITGARMHPNFFRIGGVALDLPSGWDDMVRRFVEYMPARLDEYETLVMQSPILKGRTVGVGVVSRDEAIEWGMTGPNLRATGLAWDFRKKRPYSGYELFDFDVPTATGGDCYARAQVRVAEMRQSLRIIGQCVKNMPPGDYKSRHAATTPPLRDGTMRDIETLITHFLGVSWGPVIPPGEAGVIVEGTKGAYSYHLISDGGTSSYRTRIRTASFPHMQILPLMCRGLTVSDLVAVLGSLDYVLADVDR